MRSTMNDETRRPRRERGPEQREREGRDLERGVLEVADEPAGHAELRSPRSSRSPAASSTSGRGNRAAGAPAAAGRRAGGAVSGRRRSGWVGGSRRRRQDRRRGAPRRRPSRRPRPATARRPSTTTPHDERRGQRPDREEQVEPVEHRGAARVEVHEQCVDAGVDDARAEPHREEARPGTPATTPRAAIPTRPTAIEARARRPAAGGASRRPDSTPTDIVPAT